MPGYIWSKYKMRVIPQAAFREAFVSTESLNSADFGDFEARRLRYEILWSQYQNDLYRNIHRWAKSYKTAYALYQYIRNIYSPAYRLGEFWKAHLWGGNLNSEAGVEGALPIVTKNEKLRPYIADIWRWSNWHVRKDLASLQGAVMGDVILRVVDDVELEKVYLELVHPGTISSLTTDVFGNIKAYEITEERVNPKLPDQLVVYRETAIRKGQNVIYRTYLNDVLYAWNDVASEWSEPYGFIPMIHIQHNDVGLGWGWSEFHPARSRMHELDDLGSLLSDKVRKMVEGSGFAFIGAKKPETSLTPSSYEERQVVENSPSRGKPQLGREEIPVYYLPKDASVASMSIDLDIAGIVSHIQEIQKDLERDYPELKFDILRASGDISGKSLRIARQPAETKVNQRRANYDDALVRAQQMALTIGGFRNYFSGISLDSYASGMLDHSIGEREVFYSDPMDKYEEEKLFWEAAKIATESGLSLEIYLARAGWTEKELQLLADDPEMQAKLKLLENLNA